MEKEELASSLLRGPILKGLAPRGSAGGSAIGVSLGDQPDGSAQGSQPKGEGGSGTTEERFVLWRAERCQGVVNN